MLFCDSKWNPNHKYSNPKLFLIREIEDWGGRQSSGGKWGGSNLRKPKTPHPTKNLSTYPVRIPKPQNYEVEKESGGPRGGHTSGLREHP